MELKADMRRGVKDGGWGWVVVFASLYNVYNYAANNKCYSVFFFPLMQEFNMDYRSVAWLSASFELGVAIISPISSFLIRKYGIRPSLMASGFIAGMSCFIASLMPEFWQIQLFMGTMCGCSYAMIAPGSNLIVAKYFDKFLFRAMLIVSLGWSFGPLVTCLLYQKLIDNFGWRGAIQIIAGFQLNMMVAAALMRPNDQGQRTTSNLVQLIDVATTVENESTRRRSSAYEMAVTFAQKAHLKIFKDVLFYLYIIAWNGFARAYFTVMIFLIPYTQKELGFDKMLASSLISALSVGELIAKFVLALLIDKITKQGRLYFVAGSFLAMSIELIIFAQLTSYLSLMSACVVLGMLGGGMSGIFNGLIVNLFSIELFPSIYGFANLLIHAVGTVTTIVIGYIVDKAGINVAFYVGSAMALTAVPTVLLMNYIDERRKKGQ